MERAHLLRAMLGAIDRSDEVRTLIADSDSAASAATALSDLLDIDQVQARVVLDMQYKKLAAQERQAIASEYEALMTQITGYQAILGSPERQRALVGTEAGERLALQAASSSQDS